MGEKYQNTIQINGKKYDAVTGRLISDTSAGTTAEHANQPTKQANNGAILDGFVRRPTTTKRSTAQKQLRKPIQKSQTLMRSAVKKPGKVSVQQKTASVPSPISKLSLSTPATRIENAQNTPKSNLVHRFNGHAHRSSVMKKVQNLSVKQPATTHNTAPQHASAAHVSTKIPAKKPPTASEKLIESALANATSHEQPEHLHYKKKRRTLAKRLGVSPRVAGVSMVVLSAVLLMGFYTVQHVPNLAMQVAATRAGIDASMPGYSPAGFHFQGPIAHAPGQVTVSFRSNTDDRAYQLTQRESNWNSDALLSNYIVANNKQYQTYVDRGRTLYIYDGSNATWVDNGVWYQVEGESAMTTDQLVRIAASL